MCKGLIGVAVCNILVQRRSFWERSLGAGPHFMLIMLM